ncbi:MAG: DUF11 domain-containing protein [Candidatus Micrarchaeota archaeon]|nr:DUF11 domain-containing protein [Candidatus Micrarchaeota archaeon]
MRLKLGFAVAVLALLLLPACAESYKTQYVADDWLKITRTVEVRASSSCLGEGVTDACANTGAIQESHGKTSPSTSVLLTAQNIGQIPRKNIVITEILSFVPAGARLVFNPYPSSFDGEFARWNIPYLESGESATVAYAFSARMEAGQVEKMADVQVSAETPVAVFSAPSVVKAGSEVQLGLKTQDGKPIFGAIIKVSAPDGSVRQVKTNSRGSASFAARQPGFYTYSAEGYSVAGLVSTEAVAEEEAPSVSAAAVTSNTGLLGALASLLPLLLAIFIVAVIVLILLNFLNRRSEDEYQEAAQQTSQQATYSQRFSFVSPESAPEKKVDTESTRQLVQARKRKLGEAQELPSAAGAAAGAQEGQTEKTVIYEEGERQQPAVVEGEELLQGEMAKEEEDIEKTIAELEALRERLRARREGLSQEAQEEEESPEEGAQEQPAQKEPIEAEEEDQEEGEEKKEARPRQHARRHARKKAKHSAAKPSKKGRKR